MPNRWMKFSILPSSLFLGILLAVLPTLVLASWRSDPPMPNPVTPEPYPYSDKYPAQVYLTTSDDLQLFYRLNIDIGNLQTLDGSRNPQGIPFKPSIATIFINPTQSEELTKAGLTPVPIPNEGYRAFLAYGPGTESPPGWPTFEEYVTRMQDLAFTHPNIVSLVEIGRSVQDRPLFCMEITDNPSVEEFEPEFKYTANHHGDETTGIEMTMRLAELLADSYGIDPEMTDMVDKMEIWLCPIYNPDGYVAGSRYNAHGVDLNRDFPDRFTDPIDDPTGREPETQAFMNFGYDHRFVMGANFHGGAEVLNYPWDAVVGPGDPIIPAYAPDDQLFYDLGIGYTSRNPDLWGSPFFDHGITRGWEWYQIWGGMQDWAYYYHGEHHVTIEISPYSPPFNQMDTYWEHNRAAMLWWMKRALTGVGGLVLDARDSTPISATVTLVGRDIPNTILTDPEIGDYHRVISEGIYILEASAAGYQSQMAEVSIVSGTLTTNNFFLNPIPNLSPSSKLASTSLPLPQDRVEYQLRVENLGVMITATVTDTLPISLTWTGELTATQGNPIFDAGQIQWQGVVSPSQPLTITYAVSVNQCLSASTTILNLAEFNDGVTDIITRSAQLEIRNAAPSLPDAPSPANFAEQQPITTTLAWAPSSDLNCDPITYDLYLGISDIPDLTAANLTTPLYDPGGLEADTAYFWYVVAKDGIAQMKGPLWTFGTERENLRIFLPLALK